MIPVLWMHATVRSLTGDNEQAILTLADYYVEQDEKQDAILLKNTSRRKNSGALEGKAGFSGRRFPVYRR